MRELTTTPWIEASLVVMSSVMPSATYSLATGPRFWNGITTILAPLPPGDPSSGPWSQRIATHAAMTRTARVPASGIAQPGLLRVSGCGWIAAAGAGSCPESAETCAIRR